ncbi:MAG: RNA-guided endonuclease InsQ/TnpB family protein [Candidatus Hodarchaeales archaeon]|jgi:putative transposase
MFRIRGYKYELRVNNKEKTLLTQCAGTARCAWNWGLTERLTRYKNETGEARYTDATKQHKTINRLKKSEFNWMYNYSKCIPQEALRDLEQAFKKFFNGRKTTKKVGFPKFKKKFRCKDSFRLTGVIRFYPDNKLVQLPRLGRLRLEERPSLPEDSRILNATVSREADSWYVSATVEETCLEPPVVQGEVLGLDAGLKRFSTLSNGMPIPSPKFLLGRFRKLQRLSRSHSRKRQGSKNRKKSARKFARFHKRVSDCRKDFLHKTSLALAKSHSVLAIEDLFVKGLMMNKKQSKYWQDLAHGEFQRLLRYKTSWYGSLLVHVPRFFPSSKLCSNCLWYHPSLTLKDRVFVCRLCSLELDRDLNAARNLVNYYQWYAPIIHATLNSSLSSVAVSFPETLNACGEVVRPGTPGHASMNQE